MANTCKSVIRAYDFGPKMGGVGGAGTIGAGGAGGVGTGGTGRGHGRDWRGIGGRADWA
jgi:hypothetical protein